ncbi:MAG: hypothetical protein ACTSUE_02050 [Promethearchaeota archaeon]
MKRSASSDVLGRCDGEKSKKSKSSIDKEAEVATALAVFRVHCPHRAQLNNNTQETVSSLQERVNKLEVKINIFKAKDEKFYQGCEKLRMLVNNRDKMMDRAISIARRYGMVDGETHKMWVINQMVRELFGKDNPEVYESWASKDKEWDAGMAP